MAKEAALHLEAALREGPPGAGKGEEGLGEGGWEGTCWWEGCGGGGWEGACVGEGSKGVLLGGLE